MASSGGNISRSISVRCALALTLLIQIPSYIQAWDFGQKEHNGYADEKFSQSHRKYWLEHKKSLRLHYIGCRWSYVQDGDEGCREDESEDGTVYWYQMANCRRANVVYRLYGSGGNYMSCNKAHYLDTFVTTNGLHEFANLLSTFDSNPPITYNDVYELPKCEEDGNGYYQSLGCSSSNTFTIDRFSDKYCLQYESTVDNLNRLNKKLSKMNCYNCDVSSATDDYKYNNNQDGLCDYVISNSGSCSSLDAEICASPYNQFSKSFQKLGKYVDLDQAVRHSKYLAGSIFIGLSSMFFLGTIMLNRRIRLDISKLKKRFKEKKRRQKLLEDAYSVGSSTAADSRTSRGTYA
mmetsp:Transcript_5783/g.8451  ORF Transcript_5783/g.8451 Transcript_5783/m.8451 type:complete len:349 (+) Transcript_5783:143-1189(+)|eukprot:CAMPEP_0196818322 /NCGR_PEP_ID=MMETSP1362-20130617/65048_1 /TAXON_ID=163516 /ORGANISM="Leptocylindrus danicus, Strain CCMP1856" /LENGTH=348 /DNA_ID=CAMNT_0042196379 /DNA_START=115 /DNA_END=1161 /DNA_ORIENTATION=-